MDVKPSVCRRQPLAREPSVGVETRHLHEQGFPFHRARLRSRIPSWPVPSSPLSEALAAGIERAFQRERPYVAWASGMNRTQLQQSRIAWRAIRRAIRRTMSATGVGGPQTVCRRPASPRWQHGIASMSLVTRADFSRPTPVCACTIPSYLYALETRKFTHDAFVHAPPAKTSMRKDVLVLDSVVAMQRLADCVRRGYHWHTSGVVPTGRASALLAKFEALYAVNAHRNTRWRRRRRGIAAAVFQLYRLPGTNDDTPGSPGDAAGEALGWSLLITDGENPARHLEALLLATNVSTPLRIGPYELVRRSRPGQSHPAWTYRMTPKCYEAYRGRALRSARGDPREPSGQLLRDLYCRPGFAGVRSQVGRIIGLFRREFRRRHRRGELLPAFPRLGYVQRIPTTGTLLSDCIRQSARRSPQRSGCHRSS